MTTTTRQIAHSVQRQLELSVSSTAAFGVTVEVDMGETMLAPLRDEVGTLSHLVASMRGAANHTAEEALQTKNAVRDRCPRPLRSDRRLHDGDGRWRRRR